MVLWGLLVFTVYTMIQFFKEKKDAPKIMIAFFSASIVTSFFLLLVGRLAGADAFAAATGRGLVFDIVRAGIWIPYFNVSKRVKATFVN